mmetsp:Transcript_33254/g.99054  ORF Transcript_33254/g.99054 Transcript_33254/m.99054 type:complete len:96 (-) Transcript_33254:47-334(-)|eukprot:363932-Chlamydomonas_euryale.AAC.8
MLRGAAAAAPAASTTRGGPKAVRSVGASQGGGACVIRWMVGRRMAWQDGCGCAGGWKDGRLPLNFCRRGVTLTWACCCDDLPAAPGRTLTECGGG